MAPILATTSDSQDNCETHAGNFIKCLLSPIGQLSTQHQVATQPQNLTL